jgi:hypothetical protein
MKKTEKDSASASAPGLDDTPRFLTEDQAGELLGLHPHQLYLHRRRGGGPPFVMFHARVRYPLAELLEWARNLPRFTSRAEAYVADPMRAEAAQRQRTATAFARKTRWQDGEPKRAGKKR